MRLLPILLVPLLATVALAQEPTPSPKDDQVLFVVAFSGGGTRAAAFGYGVTLALSDLSAGDVPMIERVDRVAGVSGGSLTAAQVALDFSPRALRCFRRDVLFTDLELELVKAAAENVLKLVRSDYNRSDAAATCYDGIFGGATLADLDASRPELWIQATDMRSGRPIAFSSATLKHMGLTPDQLSLGKAVAASAAVPGVLPPLNMRVPGHAPARCPGASCASRRRGELVTMADGGISDNLALEALFEGGIPEGTRAVVVVVVNSRRGLNVPWQLEDSGLISAGYTVALQQHVLDRLVLDRARERLRVLALEAQAKGRSLDTRLEVISFDASPRKESLDRIGTRFHLERSEVNLLIDEGRRMATEQLGALRTWETQNRVSVE